MSEQQPLIEEPKPAGPGKDPEICGTCRYQGYEDKAPSAESMKRCFLRQADEESCHSEFHPRALDHWLGCRYWVHAEARRDR